MAKITILDSGYLTSSNTNRLDTGFMANGGSPIYLNAVRIAPSQAGSVDKQARPGSNRLSEVNFGSAPNPEIVISGLLKSSSTDDMALAYALFMLPRTIGYKYVYYPSTGTDKNDQLVYRMAYGVDGADSDATNPLRLGRAFTTAEQTTFTIAAYYYIRVRFTSFTPIQEANSEMIRFELVGVITA